MKSSGGRQVGHAVNTIIHPIVGLPDGFVANLWQLDSLIGLVFSGVLEDRIDAINMLGRKGTPTQRQMMSPIALDEGQEVAVRLAAVDAMDWETNLGTITKLLQPGNDFPIAAIVNLASEQSLSDTSRLLVNREIEALFSTVVDFNSRLAIVEYFAERDPDKFDSLAAQLLLTIADTRAEEAADFYQLLARQRLGRCVSDGGSDC